MDNHFLDKLKLEIPIIPRKYWNDWEPSWKTNLNILQRWLVTKAMERFGRSFGDED